MTSTAERAKVGKDEIVGRVAARVGERLEGQAAEEAARFVDLYYAHLSPQDVLERDEGDLLGAPLALWRFAGERRPGEAKVRLFNPQPQEDGFRCSHTVAQVAHDDMPFLVDSVTGELNRRGHTVHLVVHPVVTVTRDAEGRRTAGPDPATERGAAKQAGALRESLMHVELDQETSPETLEGLREALERVLADVRTAVADWRPMRQRLGEIVHGLAAPPRGGGEALQEARTFLLWLEENHFTFLGFREFDLVEQDGRRRVRVRPGSGLGLLRDTTAEGFPLSPERAPSGGHNPLLVISKAGRRSTVHRPVHMDYVGVRRLGSEGEAVGGASFVGLFTSGVYHTGAAGVPFLAGKIERVTRRAGFTPGSHDAKALLHILETFPRDELFQIGEDELFDTALGVLQLQERPRVALFVRRDPAGRYVSCLVYVPYDRYDTALRLRMVEILADAYQGSLAAFYTQVADSPLARAHFIVRTTPGRVPEVDPREVEARLAEAALSWTDRLGRELVGDRGEQRGLELLRRYRDAFPTSYRERCEPAAAVDDVDEIEALLSDGGLRTRLDRPPEVPGHEVRFKIFHTGGLRPLSDVLPMLENMGLRVVSEVPYRIAPEAVSEEVWLRSLVLATSPGPEVDPEAVGETFQQAFARLWWGEMENDPFNRLVLTAGLGWRQVVVLRAYARYLRQVGTAFSQTYLAETLARHPQVARLLVALFEARFDPDAFAGEVGQRASAERQERCRGLAGKIRAALDAVTQLDEDRILRRFRNLIEATLRSNFFQRQTDGGPRPHLSLKLDGRRVRELPKPKPAFEIFVYSPRVEAVHLRGGPVARGGIRWSDRPEDFRTEILGLLKAQMVKNAVIVPVGAKGGFIVKGSRSGRPESARAEGIECYKTMIRGLLDLTDNLEGDTAVPPPRVVRWDGDDPYLVVAADKGTATFSDIANEVAAEVGFWLGDAFASGGSAGYDHKRMGITARGAWESVKRHFREMGRNVDSEPFTAVGVGDMSGDVFGNGMLLSPATRLVGAFNHQHVFLDPDPDPVASRAERERLFRLPHSTWADYDRRALSAGGGVFERSAKSVPLSPEARRLLGVETESLTPDELVRTLLRAEVDLLWFGGIGTFVKASGESHAATGDRWNDRVRIDATELRAKVVGEGANLGLTQRARIEYALARGRINTDFLDNSGGVDCSDHEVNIKILLGEPVAGGRMSLTERNALLDRMTDEVARLVLRDNDLQAQAVSVAEAEGVAALEADELLMQALERAGRLDRALETLPDAEALAERRALRQGLTRPEIAVLLALAKIHLFEELLASDLPEDPLLVEDLFLYFPQPLCQSFRAEMESHRLRREIIATQVANSTVNRVGPTFVHRLAAETGRGATDIARAYTIARESFALRALWADIEALDHEVSAETQISLLREAGRLVERVTRWLLRHGSHPLQIAEEVGWLQPAVSRLAGALETLLAPEERKELEIQAERRWRQGVPDGLAHRIASLDLLGSACDVAALARSGEADLEEVGRVYFRLGSRFRLEPLRAAAAGSAGDSPWGQTAADALVQDLLAHQRVLAASVLAGAQEGEGSEDALAGWLAARQPAVERFDQLLDELRTAPAPDLAAFLVVERYLRALGSG